MPQITKLSVVAVSVSSPRNQDINGHRVKSAIVRQPLTEPLHLTTDGISGNRSAAHDAQVYALFTHHYDTWSSKLGVPRTQWNWCHWGENLALETDPPLDESEVRIGDIWRFSTSRTSDDPDKNECVELEVYGARVPCGKLAWRCGQKDTWLSELAATGNCGVYLRVHRGGYLAAGDVGYISRSTKNCGRIPIGRIPQLCFGGDSPENRAMIQAVLEQDALIKMNRIFLQWKLDIFRYKEMKGQEGWKGWRQLSLLRVQDETEETKSFFWSPSDGKPLPPYSPGQFIALKVPTADREFVRCWSISQWSVAENPTELRLTIKKAGPASTFLHELAAQRQGDATTGARPSELVVQARAPAGHFVVDRSALFARRQIYITAGIGLTPIIAMLYAHMQDEGLSKSPGVFVHVTKNKSTQLFPAFLDSLPSAIEVIIFYTEPRGGIDVPGRDYHYKGRPERSFWLDYLSCDYYLDPMKITPIPMEGKLSNCYVCGPASFQEDTRSHLKTAGVPDVCIRSESFDTAEVEEGEPPEDLKEAEIRFVKSGKQSRWERGSPLTILEIAEQAGLEPSKGCEAGACGTCKSKLICGDVAGGKQKDGSVHICIARPAAGLVEIEL